MDRISHNRAFAVLAHFRINDELSYLRLVAELGLDILVVADVLFLRTSIDVSWNATQCKAM